MIYLLILSTGIGSIKALQIAYKLIKKDVMYFSFSFRWFGWHPMVDAHENPIMFILSFFIYKLEINMMGFSYMYIVNV